MDVTQVINYIMGCDPTELSTINDALSDRLDELFSFQAGEIEAPTPAEEEEAALPPESF